MARLIDVDAFLSRNCIGLKGPNDGKYDSCSECLGKPHGYCCMEVKGDEIYNAPTIDAIPVAWIMKWSNKRYRETQRDVSIVDVLEAWKKEQEVQK